MQHANENHVHLMEFINQQLIMTHKIFMDFQNFGIQWKVCKEKCNFILKYFILQDILKIGGPYTRLAFLNASSVSLKN
jgi:hypothetical protein